MVEHMQLIGVKIKTLVDIADERINGSNDVTVWLRFNASIDMFNTAMWSAMKKASNLPRSRVCAKRLRCAKLKLASGKAPG
jgi:hypothetical protein